MADYESQATGNWWDSDTWNINDLNTKFEGFPANISGKPDHDPFTDYGSSGVDRVYCEIWTATHDGTITGVNLYHWLSLGTFSNIFVVAYNGNTLVGKSASIASHTETDKWTGYITLIEESTDSLIFSKDDVIRFGVGYDDATVTSVFGIDQDGGNGVEYDTQEWVGGVPPATGSFTSSAQLDFGAILSYDMVIEEKVDFEETGAPTGWEIEDGTDVLWDYTGIPLSGSQSCLINGGTINTSIKHSSDFSSLDDLWVGMILYANPIPTSGGTIDLIRFWNTTSVSEIVGWGTTGTISAYTVGGTIDTSSAGIIEDADVYYLKAHVVSGTGSNCSLTVWIAPYGKGWEWTEVASSTDGTFTGNYERISINARDGSLIIVDDIIIAKDDFDFAKGYPSSEGDTISVNDYTVTYNLGISSVKFDDLNIRSGGKLIFPPDAYSRINFLASAVFTVWNGGELEAGTSTTPIGSNYYCRMYWEQGATERYVFDMINGCIINIYGDPDYYGSTRYADLDSDWTTGQTLYVTGDYTSLWSGGLFFYIHKNDDYVAYGSDAGIFEIASIGAYDSGNDRTPITIVETAPAVTYTAVHATTGYQSKLIMVSRNVEMADPGASWDVGGFDTYSPRIRVDNYQLFDNHNINFDNMIFYGWHRCCAEEHNIIYNKVVFLNNEHICDGTPQGFVYDMDAISNLYGFYTLYKSIITGSIVSNHYGTYNNKNCYIYDCNIVGNDYGVRGDTASTVYNSTFGSNDDSLYGQDNCLVENCNIYTSNFAFRPAFKTLVKNCDLTDNVSNTYFDGEISSLVMEDCTLEGIDRFPLRVYSTYGDALPLESGDTNWETPPSGNSWILEAIPSSDCRDSFLKKLSLSPLGEMSDYVNKGPNTLSFKIYPSGWTVAFDQDDIVLEVSYFDGSGNLRTTAYNTTATYANDDWRDLFVTFTTGQAGVVYFNLYINRYDSGEGARFVLIDPVWSIS